jgi:hypothetical protein
MSNGTPGQPTTTLDLSKINNSFKENVEGWNLTDDEFYNRLQNKDFAFKVNQTLSENVEGWKYTEQDLMSAAQKKKPRKSQFNFLGSKINNLLQKVRALFKRSRLELSAER